LFEYGLAHSQPRARRILEIGPGDGDIARLCADSGYPYEAIEGSAGVVTALRRDGHTVHQGYAPPLPETLAQGFTCCFLLHVIEHMPSPAVAAQLIEEIRARLRPGGALVVACPDYAQWGARFYDCDYTHTFPVTRRRLRQLLSDQGLSVVVETRYSGIWFGTSSWLLATMVRMAYPAFVDGLIGAHIPGDVVNRGALAFMPNLLAVAVKAT
jgi:SAM-dependent methyltransferase